MRAAAILLCGLLAAADKPPLDAPDAKTLTKALVAFQAEQLAAIEAQKRVNAAMDAYLKSIQATAAKRPGCSPELGEDLEWVWNCRPDKPNPAERK